MNKTTLAYVEKYYSISIPTNTDLSELEWEFLFELERIDFESYYILIKIYNARVHMYPNLYGEFDIVRLLAMALKINKFDEIFALILFTKYNYIGIICKQLLEKYQK